MPRTVLSEALSMCPQALETKKYLGVGDDFQKLALDRRSLHNSVLFDAFEKTMGKR